MKVQSVTIQSTIDEQTFRDFSYFTISHSEAA